MPEAETPDAVPPQETGFEPNVVILALKTVPPGTGKRLEEIWAKSGLDTLFDEQGIVSSAPLFRGGPGGVTRAAGLNRIFRLETDGTRSVETVITAFVDHPAVLYAEPNYYVTAQLVPNDPYLVSHGSWGQAYADLWGHHQIDVTTAWDTATGQGVVVAVADTGCDFTHPEMVNQAWLNVGEIAGNGIDDDGNGFVDDLHGWNFVENAVSITDRHGHGTHVAGTIAAEADNGLGLAGIAHHARIMGLKVLDDDGRGTFEGIAEALVYAADNGAHIVNMSLGGNEYAQFLDDALAYAHGRGVVLVAAAGNSNRDIGDFFPASSRYVVTVGASDTGDRRSDFSNYGGGLDLLAPGGDSVNASENSAYSNILSAQSTRGSDSIFTVDQQYARFRGTSMAAPHAAGVAALVLQRFSDATPEEVRQILRAACDDVLEPGRDDFSGYGRLNAARALVDQHRFTARLFSPRSIRLIVEEIAVEGVADASSFTGFQLAYGEGASPSEWHPLTASDQPGAGVLFTWDTRDLPDTTYTLRLTVTGENGAYREDRTTFTLDRTTLTTPLDTTLAKRHETLVFTGTAAGGGFSGFQLAYFDPDLGDWSTAGFSLSGNGANRITADVLGAWDTSVVQKAGLYPVRLTVTRTGLPDVTVERHIGVDPDLRPGWPVRMSDLIGVEPGAISILDNLVAVDLEGDGKHELITGYLGHVVVVREDGSVKPGWPQTMDNRTQRAPIAADLNADGFLEVIAVTTFGQVYVWSHDGVLWDGWPRAKAAFGGQLAAADLNGDGTMEIISTSYRSGFGGKIEVFHADGGDFPNWPRFVQDQEYNDLSLPAVGDLDGDGQKEIVLLNQDGDLNLYVFQSNGSIRPGWPIALCPGLAERAWAAPALGDINADGRLEIVINTGYDKVFAFNDTGQSLPGWPLDLPNHAFLGSPVLGDVDGDTIPDVVLGAKRTFLDSTLYAWNGKGENLPGWPFAGPVPVHRSSGFQLMSLVDLDGDGAMEVLGEADPAQRWLTLWGVDGNGTLLDTFPKPVSAMAMRSNAPAIVDFDGDGLFEIALLDGGGHFLMWDTQAVAPGIGRSWPMIYHDPQKTRALTCDRPLQIVTHPADQFPAAGCAVNLDVAAVGEAPSFQWYRDGVPLPGKTTARLTFSAVSSVDSGDYACLVSNPCNAIFTQTATLRPREGFRIVAQTGDAAPCAGTMVTLSVQTEGAADLSFQWFQDGVALEGEDGTALSFSADPATDGTYQCVVSDGCGSLSSEAMTVQVQTAPTITAVSPDVTVCDEPGFGLWVAATGDDLRYQWFLDGTPIDGAEDSTFPNQTQDTLASGVYTCQVSNACGTVISAPIQVHFRQSPSIQTHPEDQTGEPGGTLRFRVAAEGTALAYQWFHNGTSLAATNQNTLVLAALTEDHLGAYHCVVQNDCGAHTSEAATLRLEGLAAILNRPVGRISCSGHETTLRVAASGTPPLSYQWLHNGNPVAGGVHSVLTLVQPSPADTGVYQCRVTGPGNTVLSVSTALLIDCDLADAVVAWPGRGKLFTIIDMMPDL
ncbi:S8 family serine peptidase [Acanthopleuribacter pedis]|uniref:S8 family serine peptidase n=1 Tax=Acanthopleuribacter pedis TaxID=442870 RepID=A0A8J7U723_9BACT|nr:S8 family serine peptidase [Acanthopleuribacter pedis]MBO1322544.1 S8 family serine peptidase [Acanthopleuribacter pedis]